MTVLQAYIFQKALGLTEKEINDLFDFLINKFNLNECKSEA